MKHFYLLISTLFFVVLIQAQGTRTKLRLFYQTTAFDSIIAKNDSLIFYNQDSTHKAYLPDMDSTNEKITAVAYGSDSVYLIEGNDTSVIVLSNTQEYGLQYYRWNGIASLPNITSLKSLGVSNSQGLETGNLDDNFTASDLFLIRWVGTLKVKNSGTFNFSLSSDDASRLYIDDVLVVNNWFIQSETARTGSAYLARGYHKVEFFFYEGIGFQEFTARWGANPDGYTVNSIIRGDQFISNFK